MQQQATNKTARSWTFTSWIEHQPFAAGTDGIKYYVYQREIAPDTQREHWQGYVTFTQAKRMPAVKTAIGDNTAHVEIAKGNAQQNYAYCTKVDSRKPNTGFYEHGELAKLGQGQSE